jgi:hypothetical protein
MHHIIINRFLMCLYALLYILFARVKFRSADRLALVILRAKVRVIYDRTRVRAVSYPRIGFIHRLFAAAVRCILLHK